MTEVRFL